MLRYQIVAPGRRTETITVVTTLIDEQTYSAADIAELYGYRGNAELDIRAIKQTLGLAHLRCLSPHMVRRELWTTLLGYNLIRTTVAAAAMLHDRPPRQLSFTAACQYVLAASTLFASDLLAADQVEAHCRALLQRIAGCIVADRPGRLEPHVLTRRRHRYPLMQQPRATLQARLLSNRRTSRHFGLRQCHSDLTSFCLPQLCQFLLATPNEYA